MLQLTFLKTLRNPCWDNNWHSTDLKLKWKYYEQEITAWRWFILHIPTLSASQQIRFHPPPQSVSIFQVFFLQILPSFSYIPKRNTYPAKSHPTFFVNLIIILRRSTAGYKVPHYEFFQPTVVVSFFGSNTFNFSNQSVSTLGCVRGQNFQGYTLPCAV